MLLLKIDANRCYCLSRKVLRYLNESIRKSSVTESTLDNTALIEYFSSSCSVLKRYSAFAAYKFNDVSFYYREKKMKIQDIKNNIKEAIEVNLGAVVFSFFF